MDQNNVDHLFRHHYGKMVSTLTKIFGLDHLETIEDAVQDTFIQAMKSWRKQMPDNPEAWLTQAAKNRMIDLFRKIKAEKNRAPHLYQGSSAITISDMFLDSEIEDNQLRMIFTACHPDLDSGDQITFALKTISGFSIKEIAASLLSKEETIKKRLSRARKSITDKKIAFEIPTGAHLPRRMDRVHEVLYLIFNEGYHSIKQDIVVRQDLCSEAIRLCQLILKNETIRRADSYALLALMCFQAARLNSRVNEENEIIDLRNQDRSKWQWPLIQVANDLMNKAVESTDTFSTYHYEAAIVSEHIRAPSFEATNWGQILKWYEALNTMSPSTSTKLNMAIVHLQLRQFDQAKQLLDSILPSALGQRAYLLHGTWAEYFILIGEKQKARQSMEEAIKLCRNEFEKQYMERKLGSGKFRV